MFDLNAIEEITGTSAQVANVVTLDVDHCANLLIAESVTDLCRPITRFSGNERIKIQQKFNRSIAQMITKADSSTNEAIEELMKQAALRVQTARQGADDDATNDAVTRLERVVNFLSDLSSNVARNGFYRHAECVSKETPLADGKDGAPTSDKKGKRAGGMDGAIGVYETKSKYTGWFNVIVEADTMQSACLQAVEGLKSAIKALLPMATPYLQGLLTDEKGAVAIQLGYRRIEGEEGAFDRFYSVEDVWKDQEANRREVLELMSAEDAVSSFKL